LEFWAYALLVFQARRNNNTARALHSRQFRTNLEHRRSVLGTPIVTPCPADPHTSVQAPNESISLKRFAQGIQQMAHLLLAYGAEAGSGACDCVGEGVSSALRLPCESGDDQRSAVTSARHCIRRRAGRPHHRLAQLAWCTVPTDSRCGWLEQRLPPWLRVHARLETARV